MRSRLALGEREPDGSPVVHQHAHALHTHLGEEPLDEAVVLADRVLERAGLARAPEAGEVGCEAARTPQQLEQLVAALGHAVQVENGGLPLGRGRAAPEHGQPVHLDKVVAHLGHAARI